MSGWGVGVGRLSWGQCLGRLRGVGNQCLDVIRESISDWDGGQCLGLLKGVCDRGGGSVVPAWRGWRGVSGPVWGCWPEVSASGDKDAVSRGHDWVWAGNQQPGVLGRGYAWGKGCSVPGVVCGEGAVQEWAWTGIALGWVGSVGEGRVERREGELRCRVIVDGAWESDEVRVSQASTWGWTVGHAEKCPRAGGEMQGEGREETSPVMGLE